jgi:peptidoglycan/LPS O-acetylase OafA/YrhL
MGLLGFAALGLVVTVVAATLTFHCLQQPLLRIKRFFGYLKRRRRSPSMLSPMLWS